MTIYLNPITKKDYFSVVFLGDKDGLEVYDNVYKKNVIVKIPSGVENIKTTWRTTREKDTYYIEIKYNENIGWVDRRFLTRGFDLLGTKNESEIDKILLNFTASIQQLNSNKFIKCFHSLKGVAFYYNNRFYLTNYNDIIDFFYRSLKNKEFPLYGILEKLLFVLEKKFTIYYNKKDEESKNIIELKNFQTITLIYKEKKIILGIEKIMEKFYISFIFLNY